MVEFSIIIRTFEPLHSNTYEPAQGCTSLPFTNDLQQFPQLAFNDAFILACRIIRAQPNCTSNKPARLPQTAPNPHLCAPHDNPLPDVLAEAVFAYSSQLGNQFSREDFLSLPPQGSGSAAVLRKNLVTAEPRRLARMNLGGPADVCECGWALHVKSRGLYLCSYAIRMQTGHAEGIQACASLSPADAAVPQSDSSDSPDAESLRVSVASCVYWRDVTSSWGDVGSLRLRLTL